MRKSQKAKTRTVKTGGFNFTFDSIIGWVHAICHLSFTETHLLHTHDAPELEALMDAERQGVK